MSRGVRWLVAAGTAALVAGALALDWPEGTAQAGPRVPGGDVERGRRLLVNHGCGGCHVIPGVLGADGKVGAPLTAWAERQYIAGAVWNTPENLIEWLVDPRLIEPGTAMPDLGVTPEQARDMAAYLYTLDGRGALGPPHLLPLRWLEGVGHVRRTGPND